MYVCFNVGVQRIFFPSIVEIFQPEGWKIHWKCQDIRHASKNTLKEIKLPGLFSLVQANIQNKGSLVILCIRELLLTLFT